MREVEGQRAGPESVQEVEGPERTGRAGRAAPVRRGRCETHPLDAKVATCDLCGRALCLSCAIPVRGSVLGQECLSKVVQDIPPAGPAPAPRPHGGLVAMVGFALVLVSSIAPWARFGDASGVLGAWEVHWSLLALCAALLGLAAGVTFRRRPREPRVEISILAVCAAAAALGAVLHGLHPPALSQAAPLGWGPGLGGSLLALFGSLRNAVAVFRPPA